MIAAVAPLAMLSACGAGAGRDTGPGPAGDPGVPAAAASDARAAATPPALRLDGSVVPIEVAADLALDPARPDFRGTVAIQVQLARPTRHIWLHGKDIAIARAAVQPERGAAIAATPTLRGELLGLALPRAIGPGRAALRIEYTGQLSARDQEGLFRATDGGRTYIYSQFESTGARRAFPCFDEPGFKVPWQLTLHVPDGMVALSNTPVDRETPSSDAAAASGTAAAGTAAARTRTLVFRRTRPLPSYLVALAVGPFDVVDLGTAGRNHTLMRIAVPKGRAAETRYAREVTGQLLEALERYFDIPYPYEKLDSVAIPAFPGAMENAGLITYDASIIMTRPNEESPQHQQEYASVAAHEMAHQWFGDLVTMAWWDDIWLNESFATFMSDRVVDDWQKSWRVADSRIAVTERAFAADSLVTARKVHNPIHEHAEIEGSFDAISYQKGGALLDMFEAWIGREPFRRAIRGYIRAHEWGSATSKDFIAALAAGSRPEIARAFESFIEQGGIPLVSLALECRPGERPALSLRQERFLPIGSKGSAAGTWTVPMCVGLPPARGAKSATQCFLFSGEAARVDLDSQRCPAWVDGNAGGHGYYRVAYAGDLGVKLLAGAGLDPAGRMAALFNQKAMVESGHGRVGDLLAIIPPAARDRDPQIVGVALRLAQSIDLLVADAQGPAFARYLSRSFGRQARAIGWTARPGESIQTSNLRPDLLRVAGLRGDDRAVIAGARATARRFLADPRALDPGLGALALAIAARSGDRALSAAMEETFEKSEDHRLRAALLGGMVMSRDEAQRERTVARLGSGALDLDEMSAILLNATSEPAAREATWRYLVAHLDQVAAALPLTVRAGLATFATTFCDEEHRKTVDTVFRARLGSLPGGKDRLRQVSEKLVLCIARRARSGADVAAFLEKQ